MRARGILLSLWDVNDRSTSELMRAFYTGLAQFPNKAAALRQAMFSVRERHPPPYHSAPFVLIGA